MVTNFMSFGFEMIELCIFEVWKKSLDQWYRSKVTYNVTSYHMLKKVELAPTPNIRVELGTLNLIKPLGNLSSHKK